MPPAPIDQLRSLLVMQAVANANGQHDDELLFLRELAGVVAQLDRDLSAGGPLPPPWEGDRQVESTIVLSRHMMADPVDQLIRARRPLISTLVETAVADGMWPGPPALSALNADVLAEGAVSFRAVSRARKVDLTMPDAPAR